MYKSGLKFSAGAIGLIIIGIAFLLILQAVNKNSENQAANILQTEN